MTLSFESLCAAPIKAKNANKVHTLPIYPNTSFNFNDLEESIEVFSGLKEGYVYSRYANPTVQAVADKIAKLESFDLDQECQAYLLSSGMAAIHTLIISLCNSGDTILVSQDLYGGSLELFEKVHGRMGIKVKYIDFSSLERLEEEMTTSKPVAVFFETPTNPILKCYDLKKVADLCKMKGIKSIVDNTFCTSFIQRPLNYGIDYVVYSATKYMSGHGICTAGAVVSNDIGFMRDRFWTSLKLNGAICSPFEAWNLNNGLKTLCVRMERQCENAHFIAKKLGSHPAVNYIHYPGLETHKSYELAKDQMKYFGAVVSIEIDESKVTIEDFANRLKIISNSPTVGDLDSLLLHPASSSHVKVDPELRRQGGITDSLFRLSIGIENREDVLQDIISALD